MARAKGSRATRKAGGGAKKRAKADDAKKKNAERKAAAEEKKMAAARVRKDGQKASKKPTRQATKKTTRRASAARTAKHPRGSRAASEGGDPTLFAALTEGERADALRVLTEDRRLSQMAKVGRYRVITVEPLTVKLTEPRAGHRLARIVIYDYSADRAIDACVDLDESLVASLKTSKAQPMLAREEEAAAIAIAVADERVKAELSLSDEAQAAMHYWSNRDTDLSFTRRSAAVLFGRPGQRPSLVAVVDLLDAQVTEIVPAAQW